MKKLMFVALIAFCAATACVAATVTVTPSDLVPAGSPTGWSLVTLNSGNALWTVAPLSNPGGSSGALWCAPGGDGTAAVPPYPGQIWMGTNAYNGAYLSDISVLTYDTWTTNSGIYKPTGTVWYDRWSGPRQQITLQMCIDPGDGNPNRILYFLPRGAEFAPYVDDTNLANRWITSDCLSDGYWFDFEYNVALNQSTWAQLVDRYPNGTIAQPATQSGSAWPNPSPPDNPNGCGITLEWGAEMYGLNNPPAVPVSTKNWWRQACNAIGWADRDRCRRVHKLRLRAQFRGHRVRGDWLRHVPAVSGHLQVLPTEAVRRPGKCLGIRRS